MAVATSGTAKLTLPTDTQILVERVFAAPKNLVYRAVTEPELVRRWWNAKRGEVTVCEIDLRVGGKWRYAMQTPDGSEVAFHGTFREIVPNEHVVQTEVFEMPGLTEDDATINTMDLVEHDGSTTMRVLIECTNAEQREAVVASGMEAGLQDAYDLLEEVAISLR